MPYTIDVSIKPCLLKGILVQPANQLLLTQKQ